MLMQDEQCSGDLFCLEYTLVLWKSPEYHWIHRDSSRSIGVTREAFWTVRRGYDLSDTVWWREMLICLDSGFPGRPSSSLSGWLGLWEEPEGAGKLRVGSGFTEGWARVIPQSRKTRTESTNLPRACSFAGVTCCPSSHCGIIHCLKLFREQHSTRGPSLVSGCGSDLDLSKSLTSVKHHDQH